MLFSRTIFQDRLTKRWVRGSVYFVSAGIIFYGMVYGTSRFSPSLIAILLLGILGLSIAAFCQLLMGIGEYTRRAQEAALAAPLSNLPGSVSPANQPEVAYPAFPHDKQQHLHTPRVPGEVSEGYLARTAEPAQDSEVGAALLHRGGGMR